jgi:hypothetical protein
MRILEFPDETENARDVAWFEENLTSIIST